MSCRLNCGLSAGLSAAILFIFGGLILMLVPNDTVLSMLNTFHLNALVPFFVYPELKVAALLMGAVQMFIAFFLFFSLKSMIYESLCGHRECCEPRRR